MTVGMMHWIPCAGGHFAQSGARSADDGDCGPEVKGTDKGLVSIATSYTILVAIRDWLNAALTTDPDLLLGRSTPW